MYEPGQKRGWWEVALYINLHILRTSINSGTHNKLKICTGINKLSFNYNFKMNYRITSLYNTSTLQN